MSQNSVENIVLEIKDKSELMVDLAYSSLLYNNRIIAQEVYELENVIDALYEEIQRDTYKDVKNDVLSIDDAVTLLKLAKAGEEIADAAREIADIQLRDVELHPILKISLRESDEVFTKVEVQEPSILCGKTLGELKLGSETGMVIIAMRHANRWLYGPNKRTQIDMGDILFAKGPKDGEAHLIALARGETTEI